MSTEHTDATLGDENEANGDTNLQSSGETTRAVSAGLLSMYVLFCLLQWGRKKG
jgi:hypothetical protein